MQLFKLLTLVAFMFSHLPNASAVELEDVTQNWTFRNEIISAFPKTYDLIPKEENANIIRVFHYFQGDGTVTRNERRIEIFYTGGDWMEFGLTYFVANSPNPTFSIHQDESAAYFIEAMSTSDREEGAVPPKVSPLYSSELKNFILANFLDSNGNVRPEFRPLSHQ